MHYIVKIYDEEKADEELYYGTFSSQNDTWIWLHLRGYTRQKISGVWTWVSLDCKHHAVVIPLNPT